MATSPRPLTANELTSGLSSPVTAPSPPSSGASRRKRSVRGGAVGGSALVAAAARSWPWAAVLAMAVLISAPTALAAGAEEWSAARLEASLLDPATAAVPHLVAFVAPWCSHCKNLGPALDAAAAELGDAIHGRGGVGRGRGRKRAKLLSPLTKSSVRLIVDSAPTAVVQRTSLPLLNWGQSNPPH